MNTLQQHVVTRLLTKPRYTVRFARSRKEIEAALRLRFEVFNLELNEGLNSSYATGLDEDEFDSVCDHLIIANELTGDIVGTYRLQTGIMAGRHLGYYSAREFDFAPYESMRSSLVELGRACVHKDHRSITVISLLWKEILRYVLANNSRYMIGCSSLTSQDASLGNAMFQRLTEKHLAAPELCSRPLPAFALPAVDTRCECPPPPKLLRAYLSIGAKICGPPAIDREFKTLDFLTILDCCKGSAIATAHFRDRTMACKL